MDPNRPTNEEFHRQLKPRRVIYITRQTINHSEQLPTRARHKSAFIASEICHERNAPINANLNQLETQFDMLILRIVRIFRHLLEILELNSKLISFFHCTNILKHASRLCCSERMQIQHHPNGLHFVMMFIIIKG